MIQQWSFETSISEISHCHECPYRKKESFNSQIYPRSKKVSDWFIHNGVYCRAAANSVSYKGASEEKKVQSSQLRNPNEGFKADNSPSFCTSGNLV